MTEPYEPRHTRPTPTREHAEGLLKGVIDQCRREGLTDSVRLYETTFDLDNASDRRVIQGIYAHMAREAMESGITKGKRTARR